MDDEAHSDAGSDDDPESGFRLLDGPLHVVHVEQLSHSLAGKHVLPEIVVSAAHPEGYSVLRQRQQDLAGQANRLRRLVERLSAMDTAPRRQVGDEAASRVAERSQRVATLCQWRLAAQVLLDRHVSQLEGNVAASILSFRGSHRTVV